MSNSIQQIVSDDFDALNQNVVKQLHSEVPLIENIGQYLIDAGGKRIRPLLVLLCSRALNYQGNQHINLATVIEFLHTATLLHDDVVDMSEMRRGQPTANVQWGNPSSVLVGDFIYSRAFQLLVNIADMQIMEVMATTTNKISEGEVLQLVNQHNVSATELDYMKVIHNKTAILFAAACSAAAILANADATVQEKLHTFGLEVGMAFQLIDDVLDYSAKQAELGKTVGDDFKEGKVTLPIILAWSRGNEEEREFWRRTIERLEQNEGDQDHAFEIMAKHNTLNDTVDRARHYGSMARDALGIFPDSDVKDSLLELVDFCIRRAY